MGENTKRLLKWVGGMLATFLILCLIVELSGVNK